MELDSIAIGCDSRGAIYPLLPSINKSNGSPSNRIITLKIVKVSDTKMQGNTNWLTQWENEDIAINLSSIAQSWERF